MMDSTKASSEEYDLVAVLGQEGRFDAAWDRTPAMQKEDFHAVIVALVCGKNGASAA